MKEAVREIKPSLPSTLDDLFIRMKSTSIHADKYADLLSTAKELASAELAQGSKYPICDKLNSNYKLLLKGFESRNDKVIIESVELVETLGTVNLHS